MAITTINQKPSLIRAVYSDILTQPSDFNSLITQSIINPMFTPVNPNQSVDIFDDNNPLSVGDIIGYLQACSGDTINVNAEKRAKDLLSNTMVYFDNKPNVQNLFSTQSAKKENMLFPSSTIIYTPTDIIDVSKQFLGQQISRDSFFSTFAFYSKVNSLGFYFENDVAWDEFKNWFSQQISMISNNILPPETMKLCGELNKVTLKHMTESFVLRDDYSQNNGPYSFARLLIFYLFQYENVIINNYESTKMGCMPFTMNEFLCPKTLIIVNMDKHAHSHPAEVKAEWDSISRALLMKPKVLGKNQIKNLTALNRSASKMKQQGSALSAKDISDCNKSINFRFKKTAPTSVDFYKRINKLFNHVTNIQTSENAVKAKKLSYQRPSRRDPNNPDRPGVASRTVYKPNLHVYLDCSGSISERQYQDAIKACIKLAKKMNVNFYFSSFSHVLSATTKLNIKGKSPNAIYKEFQKIHKVAGGTDYEQIWTYINSNKKREKEISLIISDFEYSPPNHYVKHPDFLYYAPISTTDWSTITSEAECFATAMIGTCPNIKKHILM